MKKIALLSILVLALVAVVLAVMLHYRDRAREARVPVAKAPQPIEGRIFVSSLNDFKVAGRAIILCGVANQKPAGLQPMLVEAARKALDGKTVSCIPVGSGTPCDGRAPASFGRTPVMQCKTSAGIDVAGELAAQGILCDLPAQSGGIYRAC